MFCSHIHNNMLLVYFARYSPRYSHNEQRNKITRSPHISAIVIIINWTGFRRVFAILQDVSIMTQILILISLSSPRLIRKFLKKIDRFSTAACSPSFNQLYSIVLLAQICDKTKVVCPIQIDNLYH